MTTNTKALLASLLLAASAPAQGLGPGLPGPLSAGYDWGSTLVTWTENLVTISGGILVQDGLYELAVLCALMVFYEFALWGLNRFAFAHHAHNPLPLPQIALIFIKTGILAFLLNHYMVNFPGVGFSFHNFPMAISKHVTLQLDHSAVDSMMALIQTPTLMVDKPINPLAIIDNAVYGFVILLIGILSFGMFVLEGLGFVASGIFTVIGPYLIPLWLLRGHPAAWAWNWLQLMLAVGSYRALASVIEYVMANLWITFFQQTLAGDFSTANWIAHGAVAVGLTFFFVMGTTMVPLWAAQVFNGAGAMNQAAAGALASAASSAASGAASVAKFIF